MRKLIIILHSISALAMIYFAIPKIIGAEVSVKGFIEISKALPIQADIFRVFTGIIEVIIASFLLLFVILSIEKLNLPNLLKEKRILISAFGNLLLLATMFGALFAEFFARETPKWLLVYIAITLISMAFINLFSLLKSKE